MTTPVSPHLTVVRYTHTYINRMGIRTLMWSTARPHTWETYEIAAWLLNATLTRNPVEKFIEHWGPQSIGTFEVREANCQIRPGQEPRHLVIEVYFDMELGTDHTRS